MHVAELERVLREERNVDVMEDFDDALLASNWMRRTGWARIFSGLDRMLLMRLIRPPSTGHFGLDLGKHDGHEKYSDIIDECRLVFIGAAIDRFFFFWINVKKLSATAITYSNAGSVATAVGEHTRRHSNYSHAKSLS